MKRIFILEDSKIDAHRLSDMLVQNGYEVVGMAENGAEAIEKVLALKPDLMFADIILEDRKMDGIATACEIRNA